MPQSTSRAFHCRLGYLHDMSIARAPVMPSTYEESQSILGTSARLLRPPRSQSAHINTRTMPAMSRSMFRAISSLPARMREMEAKKREFQEFGHDECCGGTSVLVILGERSMEAVSQDWRARGSLESSRQRCVGLVGLQGLPLVLDIPWTFGLASFHSRPPLHTYE